VGAGKLLETGVEAHLSLPIKQDHDGPPALPAVVFLQVHGGRLTTDEKLRELIRKFLSAEVVLGDVDDELGSTPTRQVREVTQATTSVQIQHYRPCPCPGLGYRILGLGP
jgi:hypothetical protein